MGAIFAVLGKYAIQFGLWCLRNPQKVDAGIRDIHALVDALEQARKK